MTCLKTAIFCLLACLLSVSATSFADEYGGGHTGYTIGWTGQIQTVHRDGDSSPRISLAELKGRDGLFAIGPLAGLRGEITVMDGTAYIATVDGGSIAISHDIDVEAPFLVYGTVLEWFPHQVPDDVRTTGDLEQLLESAAREAGIDPETDAFPFRITTSASAVEYHVISNTDSGYSISRPHEELMVRFSSYSEPVTLIGVFSISGGGVFTHRGKKIHIHVVGDGSDFSGHVDSLELSPGAILYLPERK